MERKISLEDLQQAVNEAYEKFVTDKEGAVDQRASQGVNGRLFGISVVLTDGRMVNKGDSEAQFTLGPIVKPVLDIARLQQYSLDQIARQDGKCLVACHHKHHDKPAMPFSTRGLRALGSLEPMNDREGKMTLVLNLLNSMSTGEPVLDEALYKSLKDETDAHNLFQELQDAGIRIDDDNKLVIDIYERLIALKMSARQVSVLGATIAADGRNPLTGNIVYDGSLSAPAVAVMASHGKHFIKRWLTLVGLPAKKSDSGAIMAVLPGFGAITAYAPLVDDRGISIKAARAIEYIANKLGLNVFASARVTVG